MTTAPHEFDRDTSLRPDGDGRYTGAVTDRWGVLSGVPNGGYMMTFALRALVDAVDKPQPLTLTTHFLRPGRVGPVEVTTEIIKTGKRNTTAQASVTQEGKEVLRSLATFGDWARDAPHIMAKQPPELPPPDDCMAHRGDAHPPIAERFDNRIDPTTIGWAMGKPNGEMVMRGWMRLADGREPDALLIPLIADGLPPPLFNKLSPGWVPTVELTVHFRAKPAPGWLRAEFRTRFVSGGFLEEDGEIWDSNGELVAISRQLAIVPR
jgi:acyl-CoA thioesterase